MDVILSIEIQWEGVSHLKTGDPIRDCYLFTALAEPSFTYTDTHNLLQ